MLYHPLFLCDFEAKEEDLCIQTVISFDKQSNERSKTAH